MVITKKAINSETCKTSISEFLWSIELQANNIELFILAFIHRSIVNERNDFAPEHNERLEFLWDAVLELTITNRLFLDFPEKQEGEMTDMRSALVRGRNLSQIAKSLNFQKYLYLWKWEEKSWWRENDYILANTVEAFIWALYLDSGIGAAENFIEKHIYSTLSHIMENKLFKDYKTLLQEKIQAEQDITPHYELISESWPDHDKNFLVGVYAWKQKLGEWSWSSKKKAQESAAENWYLQLNN